MNESARPSVISEESQRQIQLFAATACRSVRPTRVRYAAEQELCEHAEDHAYRLLLQGIPEDRAVSQALGAMGDTESLCHALCAVHNRIPPDLGKNLALLALRTIPATLAWGILSGFGLLESHPVLWLIPFLIVFGLAPFRLVRSLVLRIKQVSRLTRLCRRLGFQIRRQASPIRSVFIPTRRPEWLIETPDTTYCVHFLAIHNRHAHMSLLDSFAYTLTTVHGQAARFRGRIGYSIFISSRTGDQTYENQSFHTLHFPIQVEQDATRVERILLLNPVPSEIRYLKGSVFEYVGNGDRVYDFTLHDGGSLATHLASRKENRP
jgi:hypothetical protein